MIARDSHSKRVLWLPWIMVTLGAVYYAYEYFLRITPSVITPELMRVYHLTGAEVGGLSAFYYHAYMPMQIVVGLLMDRYGPRRLLTIACVLCAVGSYLFAVGDNFGLAALGRFLVGFGSAFAFVGALKLATIWLPADRFAFVSGLILCLGMIGAMAGNILLRSLIDALGWQNTIYLSAFAGLVLSLLLWVIIRDYNPFSHNRFTNAIDFKGLLKGLWFTLKKPQIWLNGLVGFLLYISLSAFAELWSIPYLEQAKGLSKVNAASVNSLIFLGWAVGGPFWGWFSDFIRLRCLPISASAVSALVLVCIILYVPGLPLSLLYLLMFLFGFFSSAQILVFAIARETSAIGLAGTAIALTNMIVMIGGNLFQPVIGKLLDMEWTGTMVEGARVYPSQAFQIALAVLPIAVLLAIITMFFIRETHGEVVDAQHHHHVDTNRLAED